MLSRNIPWLLILPLSGCAYISDDDAKQRLDPDGDGIDLASDCDNTDASVGGPLTWHLDLDGDSYGDPDNTVEACSKPDNAVVNSDDCWDDADNIPDDFVALNGLPQPDPSTVYPGADNTPYDGINQSCAEDFDTLDEFDSDGDGYASAHYADRDGATGEDCIDGADLDDPNLAGLDPEDVNPDATEVWYDGTDADCDGNDCDQDGDGYDGGEGSDACAPSDCDDTDATISPDKSVTEIYYNGIDDNCDISVGDQDGDADSDGYWADDYTARVTDNGASPLPIPSGAEGDCWDDPDLTPPGFDAINGKAQPGAADVSPAAAESWYDGVDQDCVGDSDFDADGDGYFYDGLPDRTGRYGDDCYDSVDQTDFDNPAKLDPALVNSGAPEIYYDGTDANCDGNEYDQDEDGDDASSHGGTDCDDTDPDTYAGADEIVGDEVSNDCDSTELCFVDDDGDSYRGTGTVVSSDTDCDDAGEASLDDDEDCDDGDNTVYPGATVVCDDGVVDNDCDGAADDECLVTGSLSELAVLDADFDGGGVIALAPAGDVVVANDQKSKVYVAYGPVTADATLSTASGVYTLSSSYTLGTSLSVSGDIDGDGNNDYVIGDAGMDLATTNGGGAWVAYGPITSDRTLSLTSTSVLYHTASSEGAGDAVSGGGDYDGDGYDDVVVGGAQASRSGTTGGRAYLFYGDSSSLGLQSLSGADASFYGGASQDRAGTSIADGSDLDGDGYDELIVGAPGADVADTNDGAAYISYGGSSRFSSNTALSSMDAAFYGEDAGHAAGTVVIGGIDHDGDGYEDFAVSAPEAEDASGDTVGRVYVVSGQSSAFSGDTALDTGAIAILAGDEVDGLFGAALSGGDLTQSRTTDLMVGATEIDSQTGAAYVFYGPFSGSISASSADASYTGSGTSAEAGAAVAGGVDVTGDGQADMLVGAPGEGAAYLFEGTGF